MDVLFNTIDPAIYRFNLLRVMHIVIQTLFNDKVTTVVRVYLITNVKLLLLSLNCISWWCVIRKFLAIYPVIVYQLYALQQRFVPTQIIIFLGLFYLIIFYRIKNIASFLYKISYLFKPRVLYSTLFCTTATK